MSVTKTVEGGVLILFRYLQRMVKRVYCGSVEDDRVRIR